MHDMHEFHKNQKRKDTNHLATKKKSAVPDALTKLRDVQLDIQPVEFKDAVEFKAAYDIADQAVKQTAEASVDGQAEVIAALAKMRSILSQRGSEKIRKEAGVTQGWFPYVSAHLQVQLVPPCSHQQDRCSQREETLQGVQ